MKYLLSKPRATLPRRGKRQSDEPVCYFKMFTALAATSAKVISDTADSSSIKILARAVSGMVSVGEKAVALVNET